MAVEKTIVVIGAGVLGLTSALELQGALEGTGSVLLVARDWPQDESIHYTSPWAGAHGRDMPAKTPSDVQSQQFARTSCVKMRKMAQEEPSSSVKYMDGYDFLAKPSDAYKNVSDGYGTWEGFRLLDKAELPAGITFGSKYRTWSLNSPVYLAFLLRKFRLRGGQTIKRTLLTVEEAFSLATNVDVVVNCSGFGFGDPQVYPIRGESLCQTCIVANPCDRTITQINADGSFTFIIPRPLEGGTIVGGTKEVNDWEENPRMETREHILEMVAKMYPPILGPKGKFEVIRDIVGRRPARIGGLRLECEDPKSPELRGKKIVHAYGAGGSGFSISWGVAEEVVKLALNGRQPVSQLALL